MKNKFMIGLLLTVMFVSSVVNADTIVIKDIENSSSYAKNSILYLVEQNIVKGDEKGNFNPKKSVSRVELVVMMARVLNLDLTNVPETATFKDVPKNHWAFKYIEAAYREGIVTGISATEFKPNNSLTREQMAVIFVRAMKLVDKDTEIELNNLYEFHDITQISSWARKEVEVAVEAGLMNGVSKRQFDPKKSAMKEQTAVVFERLMKNQDEIKAKFKEETVDQTKAKLTVNGEAIGLKNSIIISEGNVFVPVEFLNRYIIDYKAGEQASNATDVNITLSSEYQSNELTNVWMQVNHKTAIKNIETNPFEDGTIAAEKKIVLENEPIQIDGLTYIPAKELFALLGIEYNYNAESNQVDVNSSKLGKSAKLYYALKRLAYNDFVGEMKSNGAVKLTDKETGDYYYSYFEMNDKQNNNFTTESYMKETVEGTGINTETTQEHIITVDNKTYTKDFQDNKWSVASNENKAIRLVTYFFDPLYEDESVYHRQINQTLFDNLHRFDVKNMGTVYLSGVPTTKYVIQFDINTIQYTMPEEEYAELKEVLSDIIGKSPAYTYTFYVAKDNVVRQTFEFNSVIVYTEPESVVAYNAFTNINYANLGKSMTIAAPPATDLK